MHLSSRLDTVGIGVFPTPLERLPRLEAELNGPHLFVKRDDLTGVALGGNKVRQLNYILADAKKMKADYVITTCGIQSNWSRQTVAMAVRMGMKALLVLRTAQFDGPPETFDGNLLLDHVMGAEIKMVKMKINEDPQQFLEAEAERLRAQGHVPMVLGLEASISPLATASYADGFEELAVQANAGGTRLDAIVVAAGAGPTQAGLALGAKIAGTKTRVVGVNVGAFTTEWLKATIERTASGASRLLGRDVFLHGDEADIRDEYAGEDYGIPTEASNNAIRLAARTDALILDPVYTSKAMAGLVAMVKDGEFRRDDNVCFIHTGGVPALFAYKSHFQPSEQERSRLMLDRT